MVYEIINEIKKGVGFSLGILLVFGALFSVYAFVEPSSAPNSNNYIDSSSKLIVMENKIDTINSIVSAIDGKNKEIMCGTTSNIRSCGNYLSCPTDFTRTQTWQTDITNNWGDITRNCCSLCEEN